MYQNAYTIIIKMMLIYLLKKCGSTTVYNCHFQPVSGGGFTHCQESVTSVKESITVLYLKKKLTAFVKNHSQCDC